MIVGISCVRYGSGQYGGVQNFLTDFLSALEKYDKTDNKYVLIFDNNKVPEEFKINPKYSICEIKEVRELNIFYRILKNIFKNTALYNYLPLYRDEIISDQIKNLKLDIIHFPITTIDLPYELPKSCKVILTFHDLQHVFFPENFSKAELAQRDINYYQSLKIADKVISISNYTKTTLIDRYNIASDKITVIYEGISKKYQNIFNEKDLIKVKEKYNLPDGFIYYPANPWPHKNHLNLLKAILIIDKKYDLKIPVVFTGCIKGNEGILKNISAEINFPDSLIYDLGFIDEKDMPYIYCLAKIMVYPSLFEGFGIPILESMKIGCPVVCSNVSSLPEVGGNAAKYINPHDISDISKKIYSLYKDDKEIHRLKTLGNNNVKKFKWNLIINQYLKTYKDCVKMSSKN